jgi:hypothetical protein
MYLHSCYATMVLMLTPKMSPVKMSTVKMSTITQNVDPIGLFFLVQIAPISLYRYTLLSYLFTMTWAQLVPKDLSEQYLPSLTARRWH